MLLNNCIEAEDGMEFDSIESALMTSCHLCGTPLEWSLSLIWNDIHELNFIHGISHSCGATFTIEPILSPDSHDGYILHIDESKIE